MKISPSYRGLFDTKESLENIFKARKTCSDTGAKLIITPHAAYEYIAEITFGVYATIQQTVENLTIIAPAIYNKIYGSVTTDAEKFETPFGDLKIEAADLEVNNKIFEAESALTCQLPVIKYLFPHVTVTPIIYGCEDYKKIAGIIKRGTTVIVSNLSRYVPERENIKLDEQTSRMIERKQIQDLDMELADGAIGICAAIEFAKQNDLEFVKTGHANSSQTNHDTSNVVGYGGWYLV